MLADATGGHDRQRAISHCPIFGQDPQLILGSGCALRGGDAMNWHVRLGLTCRLRLTAEDLQLAGRQVSPVRRILRHPADRVFRFEVLGISPALCPAGVQPAT